MAEKILKSIIFPGLEDTYIVPEQIRVDWNQNDPTAADYIKNRPFYTSDLVETELIDVNAFMEESGAEWSGGDDAIDGTNFLWQGFCVCRLEAGMEYSVTINGSKYTGIATTGNMFGEDCISFGDFEAFLSDDMDNFTYLVAYAPAYASTMIGYKSPEAPTECKIYGFEQEIVKLDPKFLPDLPKHIQSDWNENDVNAEGYIANRPFYEGYVPDEELVAEQVAEVKGYANATLSDSLTLVEGETYFVTFDGVLYECVAWADLNDVFIGNGDIFAIPTKGNNEPFVCINYDGIVELSTYEPGTYTIKIQSTTMGVAKKIDPKFLPDDIGGNIAVDSELNSESENPVQNKVVSESITNLNTFVNEAIDNLNTLVGDAPVSEQISEAIAEIPEGFSGSWSDLTDKPFEVGKTYTWSVNEEYSERVSADGITMVKIGDDAPDHSSFIGGTISLNSPEGSENGVIQGSDIDVVPEFFNYYTIMGGMIAVVPEESIGLPNGIILTKGVWVVDLSTQGVTSLTVSTCAKPVDESVIPDTIARASHTHSWNDLTDKPFGDECVCYEWDNSVEYAEFVLAQNESGKEQRFEKISNDAPTPEYFVGKTFTAVSTDGQVESVVLSESYIHTNTDNDNLYAIGNSVLVCMADGTEFYNTVLTKGIWCSPHSNTVILKIVGLMPLNEKYIPDSIARVSDIPAQEQQVQADWNQTDETATNYIKNKPSLATSEEIKALFD